MNTVPTTMIEKRSLLPEEAAIEIEYRTAVRTIDLAATFPFASSHHSINNGAKGNRITNRTETMNACQFFGIPLISLVDTRRSPYRVPCRRLARQRSIGDLSREECWDVLVSHMDSESESLFQAQAPDMRHVFHSPSKANNCKVCEQVIGRIYAYGIPSSVSRASLSTIDLTAPREAVRGGLGLHPNDAHAGPPIQLEQRLVDAHRRQLV